MANKVKIAVVSAGGRGTRFWPTTKSTAKEMLPLGNKPVILHVVEEIVKSGITHIIFTVASHKPSVQNFFTANEELKKYYEEVGKVKIAKEMERIETMADFTFVNTNPPYGNGASINDVRHIIKDQPFVLLWGDEIVLSKKVTRLQQCMQVYNKYEKTVISAIKIDDPAQRCNYGMAKFRDFKDEKYIKEIVSIKEKPALGKEPSEYAAHGAYIFTPDVFEYAAKTKVGKGGEFWLADVINNMNKDRKILARLLQDVDYLDCGNPLNYFYSQLKYALNYSPMKKEVLKFIKSEYLSSVKKYPKV